MLWLVLILVVVGVVVYLADKKIKAKFEDKFNPADWGLPRSAELPATSASPTVAPVAVIAEKIRYEKKASVFNSAKLGFIKNLRAALTEEFALLTNINAADVLTIIAGSNLVATQVAGNNIAAKQIDVVVCDKVHLVPVCIILLSDDKQPMLVNACESAKLPIVLFKLSDDSDAPSIRAAVLTALGITEEKIKENINNESVLDILDVSSQKSGLEERVIDFKICPECSAVMLKRKAKTGVNAGKLFWICSTYPKCRGMLPIK